MLAYSLGGTGSRLCGIVHSTGSRAFTSKIYSHCYAVLAFLHLKLTMITLVLQKLLLEVLVFNTIPLFRKL